MKITVTELTVDAENIKAALSIESMVTELNNRDYRLTEQIRASITDIVAGEYIKQNMSSILKQIREDELMNQIYFRLTNVITGKQ